MSDDAVGGGSVTPVRVVTWNINHWRQPLLPVDTRRGAWDLLAAPVADGGLGAQIALLQESSLPAGMARERAVFGELAGHRNWGSAVVSLDPSMTIEPIVSVRNPWSRRRFRLDAALPGSTAVARVTVPGLQPLTVVSVYGVFEGSALASMHRVVADLLPLFDSPDGARVILGGDLNITQATRDPKYLARAEALLAAVQALGLVEVKTVVETPPAPPVDCPCRAEGAEAETCAHIATWGRAELDHLYVSPALVPQVGALTVAPHVVKAGLSDHVPLVLGMRLTSAATPHAWDEEAFAVEIGRRHGSGARSAVEALVSWAEQKERALAAAAGVTAKVLTRFPVNGVTAEPELMLPVDIQTEPRGTQPTISIRADGRVVVWLGGMRLPPFDTESARQELRRALNGMDGVHLHHSRVNGWPRFDLAQLEKAGNLLKLVDVLDRIADETRSAPTAQAEVPPSGTVTAAV